MGTKTLLSLEEFVRLPDDGMRHELDEGELLVTPPVKFRHTQIAKRIYDGIFSYLVQRRVQNVPLGEVFSETPYLLKHPGKGAIVRQPDISYLHDDRPGKTRPDAYIEGAPVLAVEVVSPTDSAELLNRKVSQYLAAGAGIVWVVYPTSREVHIFGSPQSHREREAKILGDADILTAPELFPEWEGIPLNNLFA